MVFRSINPTTGDIVREVPETDPARVDAILAETREAFLAWRSRNVAERARPLARAAMLLRERSSSLAMLMAEEMGKPVREGRAEAEKCAWVCEHVAKTAEESLRPEAVPAEGAKITVSFQPLGIVLAIMPWNFPFWQVVRFAAPALAAGNAVLLKHAPNVPGCALALEALFEESGFPAGLVRAVFLENERALDLIDRREVAAVTLTGSTRAGRAVAERAGRALKKSVLELGGSDPYIILEDADLDEAAAACAASRLINAGQSCISAKRFIAVESVHDAFLDRFWTRMKTVRTGDPLGEDTALGPLARMDLRENLHRQVMESVEKGARCVLGGRVPEGKGWFYPPTVLVDVAPGMPAYEEELFGPVASVILARDEKDAMRIANDTSFGLGAAVFTRDSGRGARLAQAFEAGACSVNDFVRSDPRLPFGGVKESGYGRELSRYGMLEFVNVKSVVVKDAVR